MKKLLVATLAVILIGLACWLLLAETKPHPLPALVTLPDGTSVRILAVTYGTNHVVGTTLARLLARLPLALQDVLHDISGRPIGAAQTATTPTPELLVWLDQRTNSLPAAMPGGAYFTALLGDGSNFVSGAEAGLIGYFPMSAIYPLHFGAFPRRDREVALNIFHHDSRGVVRLCNRLSFINPLARTYPQWRAEPLPATKRAGDVEVTLQGFETGHDNNSKFMARRGGGTTVEYGTKRLDGRNYTVVNLELRPLTSANEIWQVAGAALSDATGNSAPNSGMTWNGNNASFAFSPGLWPGEAAWKLKLEIKKTEGFRPEEIFVFKNVPLGGLDRTNIIGWVTNVAGVMVTLQSICRRAPQTNSTWSSSQSSVVHLILSGLATATAFDMLRMICDSGITNRCDSWSTGGNDRDYSFREIPLAAQTADFTFAIQQSRTVEFTVKPELPKLKTDARK